MRLVVQRVYWAEVEADGAVVGRVETGLLVYVGVATWDNESHADWLAEKVANLRIFDDAEGKLNLSVQDARGGVLAVPNFTLQAGARKGRRPAFVDAQRGERAEALFRHFADGLARRGVTVARGAFGAHMVIRSSADGPVNIVLDYPDSPARSGAD